MFSQSAQNQGVEHELQDLLGRALVLQSCGPWVYFGNVMKYTHISPSMLALMELYTQSRQLRRNFILKRILRKQFQLGAQSYAILAEVASQHSFMHNQTLNAEILLMTQEKRRDVATKSQSFSSKFIVGKSVLFTSPCKA